MIRVLGIGDNVCDVYLHTGMMYPGGQAVNFAVNAVQLGFQADFLGIFGNDAVGHHVKRTLDALGIGYSHSKTFPGDNGFARVALENGDRVFKGSNRGGVIQQHPIDLGPQDLPYLSQFRLIHATNNGFLDDLLPFLSRLPTIISYDFSMGWRESDRIERVCPHIDVAFLSSSHLTDKQTQALCKKTVDSGCKIAVATRGAQGTVVYDGATFYQQLPEYVEPLDTMGAGDSFATAFMMVLAENLNDCEQAQAHHLKEIIPKALKKAAAHARKTCLVHGAFDHGVPVPESIHFHLCEKFLC
ncbi:MAG: PfkB family carbohydrate kinase [Candidatus Fimivivens sp.]